MLDPERKEPMYEGQSYDYDELDLSQLDIVVDVPKISELPNDQYAILRKHGLGTSDSSIVCEVNPYTSIPQLIEEKSRDYLTPEERAVGTKDAVVKGREFEPVVIARHSDIIKKRIMKPSDMYKHKEFPWLKFNFDGVIDKTMMPDGKYQYIPDEIKVVTKSGLRHYNPALAYFRESTGVQGIPQDYSGGNNSIQTKAAQYGIPPYYYTQVQQQIFGLKAPYGYLTVMLDSTSEVVSFFIWRDEQVIRKILSNGWRIWEAICKRTNDPNRDDISKLLAEFKKENEAKADSKSAFTIIES